MNCYCESVGSTSDRFSLGRQGASFSPSIPCCIIHPLLHYILGLEGALVSSTKVLGGFRARLEEGCLGLGWFTTLPGGFRFMI